MRSHECSMRLTIEEYIENAPPNTPKRAKNTLKPRVKGSNFLHPINVIYKRGGKINPRLATPKVPTILRKSKKFGITLVITVNTTIINILSEYTLMFFFKGLSF